MTSVTTINNFADYYMNVDDGPNSNRAVARFNKAMDTTMTTNQQYVDCWTDPHGVVIVHLENGGIAAVHGIKSVGGTFETPDTRVVGHIGMNTRAIAGFINHGVGASTIDLTIPTKGERANCISLEDMRNLAAATKNTMAASLEDGTIDDDESTTSKPYDGDDASTVSGGTRSKKKKKAKTAEPDKYTIFAAFKPATFLQKLIIERGVSSPEETLAYVKEAMDDFEYPPDSNERDYRNHVDRFEVWCYGVMVDQVPKVVFRIDPHDDVICKYSDEYHRVCLGNKDAESTSRGMSNVVGPSGTTDAALKLLTESVFRMKEDNESTADVLSRQLTFQKEVERKKKDKTEEWHASTTKMILFGASTDGENPASSIPKSYLEIINSKSVGIALQSIQASMSQRGHVEVGFPEVLAQALQKGQLLYKTVDKPGNFTVLCLHVLQPLCANMSSRGVEYHYQKKEDFSKMSIHIPSNIDEMLIVLEGFHGLIEITFGDESILAVKWREGIDAFKNDRARLRANMAQDPSLIAKMMVKLDLHVQRWIEQCNNVTDREFVDDNAILCFTQIVNDGVMNNINGSLPKAIRDLLDGGDDEDDGTKKGKRKNGKDGRNGNRDNFNNSEVVMNDNQIDDLKLNANEQYVRLISGKGVKDRVAWDNEGCMMCVRWHIGGRCVRHCKHAASHVPASQVPSEKKAKMTGFLKKMRELAV